LLPHKAALARWTRRGTYKPAGDQQKRASERHGLGNRTSQRVLAASTLVISLRLVSPDDRAPAKVGPAGGNSNRNMLLNQRVAFKTAEEAYHGTTIG
jgi:hypothetical protein